MDAAAVVFRAVRSGVRWCCGGLVRRRRARAVPSRPVRAVGHRAVRCGAGPCDDPDVTSARCPGRGRGERDGRSRCGGRGAGAGGRRPVRRRRRAARYVLFSVLVSDSVCPRAALGRRVREHARPETRTPDGDTRPETRRPPPLPLWRPRPRLSPRHSHFGLAPSRGDSTRSRRASRTNYTLLYDSILNTIQPIKYMQDAYGYAS
jgi:hypothetical protein